jgi:molecular chaperone GrpE
MNTHTSTQDQNAGSVRSEPEPNIPEMNNPEMTEPTQSDPETSNLDPSSPEAAEQSLPARISKLEAELQDMRDRWMRGEAEIANVRARGKREVDETRQYAVQKFARDVVEAAENIKRGLDSLPHPGEDQPELVARLREGFEGVERSFVGLLERNGIRREDPTGATFDPNLHQAMAEQETADHPPGTVIQAWTPAWTLNGRLLRPAMVVVAKAPAGELSGPAASKIDTVV